MATKGQTMTNAYQLKHVRVIRQQQCILDIDDLQIAENKCIALLGDNGAGKSTLLNLLAFTQRPSRGQIVLLQQTIKAQLTPAERRRIGYVSQQPYLLSGSVEDNIKLALKLQGIPAKEHTVLTAKALVEVNLSHLATQTASTLSGGELKRAAIARAIAHQPDILLLDEPFSHLDQSHIEQMETVIDNWSSRAGKTVIFSTHDRLQGAALADSTINLIRGQVTQSPLINVFHGKLKNNALFDTGKIQIHTTSQLDHARHIAIDPHEIIISKQVLDSSMRNHFQGRLTAITEEAATIRLTVDCGERFHAIISPESLHELALRLGETICLSFKSSAVSVF